MSHRPLPRHKERKLESAAKFHDLTSKQTRAAMHECVEHRGEDGYTPTQAVKDVRDNSAHKFELVAA